MTFALHERHRRSASRTAISFSTSVFGIGRFEEHSSIAGPDEHRLDGRSADMAESTPPARDSSERASAFVALRPMPTELVTPRLRLDAWRDDDLDDYDTLVNERDLRTAAAPHGGPPTRGELRKTILRQQASHIDTGIGLLVIRIADRFAGYCGLTVGRASLAEPELAYELLSMYQGNGYATEAAHATVQAAAGTGRRRLWATVRTWNDASFRVLEKVGFARTDRITSDDFGEIVWCTREL